MRRTYQARTLWVETLEQREVLAASVGWDGPGRGSAQLTYYIGSVPSNFSLSAAQVQSAIETALRTWSTVADVHFVKTSKPGLDNSIDITFSKIDGAGGTLAQTYLPKDLNKSVLAGDVQFDTSETFEIGNQKGSAAFDFLWVAVHELGHSLGLEHSSVPGSVMLPSVDANQVFTKLVTDDVRSIQTLYSSAPGSVDTLPNASNPNGGSTTPSTPSPKPTTPNPIPRTNYYNSNPYAQPNFNRFFQAWNQWVNSFVRQTSIHWRSVSSITSRSIPTTPLSSLVTQPQSATATLSPSSRYSIDACFSQWDGDDDSQSAPERLEVAYPSSVGKPGLDPVPSLRNDASHSRESMAAVANRWANAVVGIVPRGGYFHR
jgi:hypothetical protein